MSPGGGGGASGWGGGTKTWEPSNPLLPRTTSPPRSCGGNPRRSRSVLHPGRMAPYKGVNSQALDYVSSSAPTGRGPPDLNPQASLLKSRGAPPADPTHPMEPRPQSRVFLNKDPSWAPLHLQLIPKAEAWARRFWQTSWPHVDFPGFPSTLLALRVWSIHTTLGSRTPLIVLGKGW